MLVSHRATQLHQGQGHEVRHAVRVNLLFREAGEVIAFGNVLCGANSLAAIGVTATAPTYALKAPPVSTGRSTN